MASIAYVTDKNMIEFHRLNGNHSINFWKPSNAKKISSLNAGDLLFFLAKGSEMGSKKEKGLIGYGKFKKSYTLSFSQMWTKYGTQNGYPTKDALQEAIMKVTKNHKIPDYLNCLLLEEVVFFQYPVYLSEIGMEISNKIESYIYIDKEDMLNTSKILKVAENFGVDMWSNLFQEQKEVTFMKDAQIQTIQNIYEKIRSSYYSSYDESRLYKYIQICMNDNSNTRTISDAKSEYIQIEDSIIKIYLPCIVNSNDFQKKLQYVLGHYMLYHGYLEKSMYGNEIIAIMLFNQEISHETKEVLDAMHILYEIRLVDLD
ncbi:hypothetical protein [Amedibacillus sp. YH-ame10]